MLSFDLGSELHEQLLESRADAESTMLDTCTIVRPGEPVTDSNTGVVTTPPVVVYPDPLWPDNHPWKHGPCKVQTYDAQESNPEAGGATFTVQRYTLHIPVGSYQPAIGDVATIVTSATDSNIVDRSYRVTGLLHKTLATAYRLGVEEEV